MGNDPYKEALRLVYPSSVVEGVDGSPAEEWQLNKHHLYSRPINERPCKAMGSGKHMLHST